MYPNHFLKMAKLILSLLVLPLLFLVALFSFNFHPAFLQNSTSALTEIHDYKHVQLLAESACDGTLFPDLCVSTVVASTELWKNTLPEAISCTINVTMKEVRDATEHCTNLRHNLLPKLELGALQDCLELFATTVVDLEEVLSGLSSTAKNYADIQTVLSAAMTNQDTCLDGLAESHANRRLMESRLRRISAHLSNSLAMVKKLKEKAAAAEEVFPEYGVMDGGFPTWLSKRDRFLLQADVKEIPINVVVAKDGSGDFTTVNEAVSVAPNNSASRFVIYIKTGAYFEYVEVVSNKKNIMFLGDGIGKTWIKGNRNVYDNWTTFTSHTIAVTGTGFLAKGISVENYAGPSKHQAVALRSSSDLSAFYQCSFIGYQDTLYVHSSRQFYRDCDVYGTIDFIFGNAAVVFQNSNLYARRPDPNQKNVFTAQGRTDPGQTTGISVINCKVAAAADLIPVLANFSNYLGRPWKLYSRTVYMYSNLESLVNLKGWLEWDGDFALDTLYYGEYMNVGMGSNTTSRVTWPGYRVINSSEEAAQFTVDNFIQGTTWLPATQIPFYPDLTPTGLQMGRTMATGIDAQ